MTGSTHFHCNPVEMADAGNKTLDVFELPEDPAPPSNGSNANVGAAVEEEDIARIEKVYK